MTKAPICVVNGKHTPGSIWAKECPLRNAEKRSERTRRANATRTARAADARRPS